MTSSTQLTSLFFFFTFSILNFFHPSSISDTLVLKTLELVFSYKTADVTVSYVPHSSKATIKNDVSDFVKVISKIIGLTDLSNIHLPSFLGLLDVDLLIKVKIGQAIDRILGLSLSLDEVRHMTFL